MTLNMPDSTDVAALPPGYGQYLGYVDGRYVTVPELRSRFPGARTVGLTVTGATYTADGCDIETGNLTPVSGADWARRKLDLMPGSRPVLYASVSRMPAVIGACEARRITRDQVRLLSAHYGAGKHICGPATCGESGIPMDGTQWTDMFRTRTGTGIVDMSVLEDGFFGSWTEELVQQLPVVRQGDSGAQVRTVQGLCGSRGWPVIIDGIFGPATDEAVRLVQGRGGIAQDGIVGPQTWPVLLGIA